MPRRSIEEIRGELKEANEALESATRELENFEPDEYDGHTKYDALLDELYSFGSVGGPFAHMSPSEVLKEVDPTAYRCGYNDWLDGELRHNPSGFDGYEEAEERVSEAQDSVDDLEQELADAEDAAEDAAEDEKDKA